MQKLLGKFRRAVNDFKLIESGDKIAVGLSGGKDSITLLNKKVHLILCKELDVPFYLIKSDIKEIVFDIRKEKNPCALCANLRRGILNSNAKQLGCTKVALGHHKNDAVETLLMSMFYEGRISSFSPKTYLDRKDITVIRPMVYIDELDIKNNAKKSNFPIIENPCPANGYTKRQFIKDLTYSLENEIPDLKDHLLGALMNSEQLSIWDKTKY